MALRRNFFHAVISVENLAVILLYVLDSQHAFLVKVAAVVFIILSLILGILLTEVGSERATSEKTTANSSSVESQTNEVVPEHEPKVLSIEKNIRDKDAGTDPALKDSINGGGKILRLRSKFSENPDRVTDSEPQQPLGINKRETLCSIQDLLANTSSLDDLYNCDPNKDSIQSEENCSQNSDLSNVTHALKVRSRISINEVGLPLQESEPTSSSSHSCLHDVGDSGVSADAGHLLPRRPAANASLSQVVPRSKGSGNEGSSEEAIISGDKLSVPVQNIDVEDHSTIVNTIIYLSEGDYENVYDAVLENGPDVKNRDCFPPTVFAPMSLLLQPVNENITAQSSGSHDYENCPAINVYRANTGVRHWKPYFNIADRVHDYSTFKERSLIQDSTLSSNVYANTLLLSELGHSRPLSLAEKASSNYSISLPDLSTIGSTACIEFQRVAEFANEEEKGAQNAIKTDDRKATEKNAPHIENCTNYEAIWYDDLEDGEMEVPSLCIEKDGKLKESMCNLYYSRLSELSANYFAYRMKRNSSLNSLMPNAVHRGMVNNLHLSKPRLLLEINSRRDCEITSNEDANSSLRNAMSTPNNKCKRSDSKRTQKSPLMRLVSLSQNSLHEHTLRALQAGKRVFYRPRVHVITPKKGSKEFQARGRVMNPQAQLNRLKINPNVLKKRGHLSPKDKLILSEASALIRKREPAAGCKTALGFATETASCDENLNFNEGEALNVSVKDEKKEGPQHSTPEGNRHHLPQMSILSTISSVASPDEMVKLDTDSLSRKSSSSIGDFSRVLAGHSMPSGRRCSSKRLNEMSVIEEFESIPSQV